MPAPFWLLLASACLLLFFAIRLTGGHGNAYPYAGASLEFWFFAEYPPDLPFLAWSFAATLFGLAALWPCAWYCGKKRDRPSLVTRCF